MGQFTTYVRPGMILQVVAVETTYAKGHRGLDPPRRVGQLKLYLQNINRPT